MLNSLLLALRFLILVFSGHKHVALENAALRHQLAILTRERRQPRLFDCDRLFWIALKRIWKDWRGALVIVRPETVISWQRKRFKRYWWRLSQPKVVANPVCLHRPSARSALSDPLQCHRASDGCLGSTANHRSVSGRPRSALYGSRPRRNLRRILQGKG
jgi:hypothetical protein